MQDWVYKGVNHEPELRMLTQYNGKIVEHQFRCIVTFRGVKDLLREEERTHRLAARVKVELPNVTVLNTIFTSSGIAKVLCLKNA